MQAQISCVSGRKIYLFSINRARRDVGAGIVGTAAESEQIYKDFLAIFECDEQKRDQATFCSRLSVSPARAQPCFESEQSRHLALLSSQKVSAYLHIDEANNQKSLPDTVDPNF